MPLTNKISFLLLCMSIAGCSFRSNKKNNDTDSLIGPDSPKDTIPVVNTVSAANLSLLEVEEGILLPGFHPSVKEYKYYLYRHNDAAGLKCQAVDSLATIRINGQTASSDSIYMPRGTVIGDNLLIIEVTANDKSIQSIYTVTLVVPEEQGDIFSIFSVLSPDNSLVLNHFYTQNEIGKNATITENGQEHSLSDYYKSNLSYKLFKKVTFDESVSGRIGVSRLDHYSFVVAYPSLPDNWGAYQIFDKNGTQILTETYFKTEAVKAVAMPKFSRTSYAVGSAIAYLAGEKVELLPLSKGGQFPDTAIYVSTCSKAPEPPILQVKGLTHQSMAVIHANPGDSSKGVLSVYKLDGSTVYENIEFNSFKTLEASLDVSIARNPVSPIIAYSYEGPSGIENRVNGFDLNMRPLKEPLLFRRGSIHDITLSTVVYRKVFLAYNTPKPHFQIVSVEGENDVPETPFGPSMAKHMTSQLISPLRSVLIAYADTDNSDWGTFMIIDVSGKIVQGPTIFEEGPVSSIAIQTTQYYRFALAYQAGSQGRLALYDYTDLMMEEVNPNQVRLTNNTGKALAVVLEVDP